MLERSSEKATADTDTPIRKRTRDEKADCANRLPKDTSTRLDIEKPLADSR